MGTAIKEDAQLLVSYYHTVTTHDGQVACSLEHPEVFKVVERQVNGVEKLLHPKQYMLSHDEIRVANWSDSGRSGRRTAGQVLAENVQRTMRIIHQVNPDARCCIWSDMFDPYHNAVKGPYYLVNGSLEGSWKGLTPEMTIINWNSSRPTESLAFFDKLGCRQVLAGYYDADPASIREWLSKAQATPSVTGSCTRPGPTTTNTSKPSPQPPGATNNGSGLNYRNLGKLDIDAGEKMRPDPVFLLRC